MSVKTLQHPILSDTHGAFLVDAAKHFVESQRLFRNAAGESLFAFPEDCAHWYALQGKSKTFTKWFLPLATNTSACNRAIRVFGRDASPVDALGDRSVTSYIRHLIYGMNWEPEAVANHLIDQHGYSYTSARPLIRRVVRQEEDVATAGKSSNHYFTHNEAALFPEGVVNPGEKHD